MAGGVAGLAELGLVGSHGGAMRPVVMGRRGAVASGHWLASEAGLDVIRDGGNAFDAAVATAAVLAVVEPFMSGVAGVGVALVYDASTDRYETLDFHGHAPAAARPELWATQAEILEGLRGAMVPGAVAGWDALLRRHGRMTLAQVLEPAVAYAADGVPVSHFCSDTINFDRERLARDATAAAVFFRNGRALLPGELLVQPQLAATLRRLADEGPDDLYRGDIAKEIAEACVTGGGLMSADDLAGYQVRWLEPVVSSYRGFRVYAAPPPFGGIQILETLRLLEGLSMQRMEYQGADHLHLLVEAIKLAQVDRLQYSNHPDFDPSLLLSERYIAARRRHITMSVATRGLGDRYVRDAPSGTVQAGDPRATNTTHLVTADAQGNLVSLTQTLGWLFGGARMLGRTGLLLNNMAYWFDWEPASPNAIGPKRRGSPLAPTLVAKPSGKPWIAVGTPGGFGILQTTVQMLSNILDFSLNPQAALEAPRLRVNPGFSVSIESRVPPDVRAELVARGHELDVMAGWSYRIDQLGRGMFAVFDDAQGVIQAAADPRGDGYAVAR